MIIINLKCISCNLNNLYDFDPDKDMVSNNELEELDKYALMKLTVVI